MALNGSTRNSPTDHRFITEKMVRVKTVRSDHFWMKNWSSGPFWLTKNGLAGPILVTKSGPP